MIKIRIGLLFIHLFLAIKHFLNPKEGQQFFMDTRKGKYKRLKQQAIKRLFL